MSLIIPIISNAAVPAKPEIIPMISNVSCATAPCLPFTQLP